MKTDTVQNDTKVLCLSFLRIFSGKNVRNKEMIEKVETSPLLTDGDRQDTLTDNDGQEGR